MRIDDLQVGDPLPERQHTPSSVSLFLYNAAVWNPHRIHYDETYTTAVEGHPGIVVDGPLQGDWLAQCVANWLQEDTTNDEKRYRGLSQVDGGPAGR